MSEQRTGAICRMIVAFGAVAILVIWVSFAGFLMVSRDTQLDAAERTSAALALALEQHCETVIAAADSALTEVIAELDELGDNAFRDRAAVHALLERGAANRKYLVGIVIADAGGTLRYDPRWNEVPPVDLSDRDYFLEQRDRADAGLFIGAPVRSRINGDLVVPMSRRLEDADGNFAGVVVATVPSARLDEFLRTLQLSPRSIVGIVRPDGTILARQPPSPMLGTMTASSAIMAIARQHPIGTIRSTSLVDNVSRINSYRALPTSPVFTYEAISVEDALADWRHSLKLMLAIGLFSSASIALLTGLLVRQARQRESAERQSRASEAQLEEARKLEAVGRLAGGIAHDFNNILGAILGFAGFLVQDLEPGSPQQRFADRIVTAGSRGKELVAQVLAFSRLNKLERRPIDLVAIVHETSELIGAELPSAAQLIVHDAGGPLIANANSAQVGRILANLCLNAGDALAGEPGTISIEISPVWPGAADYAGFAGGDAVAEPGVLKLGALRPEWRYARIRVTDTGIGMSREQLPRVFEPFFTTKSDGSGTGLGLAIVHGTVMAYDGACLVTSRAGAGTSFAIYLPLLESGEPAVAAPQAPEPSRSWAGERILVVDDEPMITETLAIGLRRLGYKVREVNDPRSALELFRRDPARWHLVISDETMPHMKGSELFRQMKSIAPALRFVLCTGYSDGLAEEALRASGIDAYFHKPVPLEELAAVIRRLTPEPVPSAPLGAGLASSTSVTG